MSKSISKLTTLRLTILCFLFLVTTIAPAQTQLDPVLKTHDQPVYPPLSRQARIQGQVQIEFVVNQNGEPVSVTAVSGHPMLAPAAEASVWTWRFSMPKSHSIEDLHLATTFDYVLSDTVPNDSAPSPLPAVFASFHHVTVTAIPAMIICALNTVLCPKESEMSSRVADGPASAELAYASCYGTGHKQGTTSLMQAAAHQDSDRVLHLLRNGASPFDVDSNGWTALLYAAAGNDEDSIAALLAKNADPNQASLLGNTPLMISATRDELYPRLLQAGANINAQNLAGTTALMILAAKGDSDEVAAAIKAGADPSFRDKMNRSALDYLHLAYCDRSPIEERSKDVSSSPGTEPCDAVERKNVVAIEGLLRRQGK
jgi:TonB family protein